MHNQTLGDPEGGTSPSARPSSPSLAERREHPRFQVAGSMVRFRCRPVEVYGARAQVRPGGLLGAVLGYSSQDYEVLNISRGGLAFETDRAMRAGRTLRIRLRVPGEHDELELLAQVRWCAPDYTGTRYAVGVRFAPFGRGAGQNPRQVYDVLARLEARHAEPT